MRTTGSCLFVWKTSSRKVSAPCKNSKWNKFFDVCLLLFTRQCTTLIVLHNMESIWRALSSTCRCSVGKGVLRRSVMQFTIHRAIWIPRRKYAGKIQRNLHIKVLENSYSNCSFACRYNDFYYSPPMNHRSLKVFGWNGKLFLIVDADHWQLVAVYKGPIIFRIGIGPRLGLLAYSCCSYTAYIIEFSPLNHFSSFSDFNKVTLCLHEFDDFDIKVWWFVRPLDSFY